MNDRALNHEVSKGCEPSIIGRRFFGRARKVGPILSLLLALLVVAAACSDSTTLDDASTAVSAAAETSSTVAEAAVANSTLEVVVPEAVAASVAATETTLAASSTTESTAPAADATTTVAPTAAPAPAPSGGTAPDCSNSCNVVMEGDSITWGMQFSVWPKFCTDIGATTCVNSGISGHRIDQFIETARYDVDNHVGSGNTDVLILWGGTNDLWQQFHSKDPTANAEGAYESTKRYIAERREVGWDYIYILTHPPMNTTYINGTERLNELIRGNSAGADVVIDLAAEPKLSNAFDPLMRADDGIHYRHHGNVVVLDEYLVPALRQLS